jgi:hypothetical protein
MRMIPRLPLIVSVVTVVLAGLVAGCSGGGTNCCTAPAFHPTPTPGPGGVVPTPTPVPVATPTHTPVPVLTPTPTPVPTPVPTPTPPPVLVACNQGAGAIPLGPALAPFAILAGSTVTNVGLTNVGFATGAVTAGVNDDLIGVSPGTAITGFYPPGTDTDGPNAIYGAGYNPDAAVPLAAQNALIAAYNAVAAKPATATVAGDLSQANVPGYPTGTLPPGVYKSTSTLSIANGNLTLDALGNPQSVFVFQMESTLVTTFNGITSGNVILENGAQACNIYWQVGSSATLGGATFYGNVLANTAITINAPTFGGRALAEGAAVSIPVAGGSIITNPGGI